MFLLKAVRAFESAKIKFALCGGQALALHGAVRGTVDIDFVLGLSLENLEAAEDVLTTQLGLVSRIPLKAAELLEFREEYIRNRNLKAWSFVNPSRDSEVIDILIVSDLCEYSIVFKEAWGQKIPVVSIADLIKMKRAAGRPQDLADIEALEKLRK